MSDLEVFLEVPPELTAGLAAGTLERVGGVVRDTASKSVVAWLRDTQNLGVSGPSASAFEGLFGAFGGLAAHGLLINAAITSAWKGISLS